MEKKKVYKNGLSYGHINKHHLKQSQVVDSPESFQSTHMPKQHPFDQPSVSVRVWEILPCVDLNVETGKSKQTTDISDCSTI